MISFLLLTLGFAFCVWFLSGFYVYLSLVFNACYHWRIGLLVWLLSSFFFLIYFLFYKFFFLFSLFLSVHVYVSLCDFVCLGLLLPFGLGFYLFGFFFFSSFSSELCGWQGPGALAGCQASASEVGELSPGHWTTRDLLAPRNNNQRELSQRSLSQH